MLPPLKYGLEWDRDQLLHLATKIRQVFWPISVFLISPLVFYVLVAKTRMDRDCKLAFIAHNIIIVCFDIYNGLFYQMYTLLPYPVFACTGLLCTPNASPRLLFTILALLTVSLCIPYLFVMIRMHQKLLGSESAFKMSNRAQALAMMGMSIVLLSNVYGFAAWSVESDEKAEILKIPSLAWTRGQTRNLLVLGRHSGDIGLFAREIYLLLFSIVVCFSFYVGIVYHAVFYIGRKFRTIARSRTHELQLRFMISMAVQALFTSILFILPLACLSLFLMTSIADYIPTNVLALLRITVMTMYSCCSVGHSSVFLFKNSWCIQAVGIVIGRKSASNAKCNAGISTTSNAFRMT